MPTLKRINAEAGTNFRRTADLVAALKEKPVQHFQAKVSEYGQLLLRAPNEPDIVGFLWRYNEYRLKNATGYFGQAVLFPAAMNPALNPHIEYRVGDRYFTGAMPDLAANPETGEWPDAARQWQWIEAVPLLDPWVDGWYQLDKPNGDPMPTVNEYDTWIFDDPLPISEPTPDLEYAHSVRERRQAIEEQQPYLSVANAAAEMGFTPDFLSQIEDGAVVVEGWHKDNIERILDAWAWALDP